MGVAVAFLPRFQSLLEQRCRAFVETEVQVDAPHGGHQLGPQLGDLR